MLVCARCGRTAAPPPARRLAHLGDLKERLAQSVCEDCWQEWEGVEVKVINEYRLNFMDPEHRALLRRACADYFKLAE